MPSISWEDFYRPPTLDKLYNKYKDFVKIGDEGSLNVHLYHAKFQFNGIYKNMVKKFE